MFGRTEELRQMNELTQHDMLGALTRLPDALLHKLVRGISVSQQFNLVRDDAGAERRISW
jgi:hypothetical protein